MRIIYERRKMLEKIKKLIKRKPSLEQQGIEALSVSLRVSDAHLVALARLLFIKPSQLVREAHNTKANAEYILEMVDEREKLLKGETKPKKEVKSEQD